MVYGPIIRNTCRLSNKKFIKLLKIYNKKGCTICYLFSSKETLLSRRKNDIGDLEILEKYYNLLSLKYEEIINIAKKYINVLIFNTSTESIVKIKKIILKTLI